MIVFILSIAAMIVFAALMLALLNGLPRETLDEQAEAIRRDREERERRRERKKMRRRMRHG